MKAPADLVSDEVLRPGSCCVLAQQKGRILISSAPYKTLIPFMKALPLWPNCLPKASPPNRITLGVRISAYEFWGRDTNVQSITDRLT